MSGASASSVPSSAQLAKFTSALFAPDDIVEVRVLPVGRQRWVPAAEMTIPELVEWLAQQNAAGQNLYVGANPRTEVGGSTADRVALARSLFVDFDGGVTADQAIARIQAAGLPSPSIVVASGHGTHCYWLLDEPMTDLAAWTSRQKGLIAQLHTDKVIHDPPRIMRLPGFLNTKSQPAVPAVLVEVHPDRRYGLEAFPIRTLSSATRAFEQHGAPEHTRNSRLFSAACDMAGHGVSEQECLAKLGPSAARSGLDSDEINRTVASAYSKPRTPAVPSSNSRTLRLVGSSDGVSIDVTASARGSKAAVTARMPDGRTWTHKIDVSDADQRTAFIDRLCQQWPDVDRDDVAEQLQTGAGRLDEASDQPSPGRMSQSDMLVAMVVNTPGLEMFHSPDGEAFASIPVDDHRENWKINSRGFRDWAAQRFYRVHNKAIGSQAMQDAIATLSGRARFDGPEYPVCIRLGSEGDTILLDLCDREWRVVQISAGGWSVVAGADVGVRFVRRKGMEQLPEPAHGGSVELLRPHINIGDDDQWTLLVGWLIGAIRPSGPYSVLAVNGEHGSAKSTLCKLTRRLIDPNEADLRRPPKNERDVFIAGGNAWICSYNNISHLSAEISDALCALATDGGFATRSLYENEDETIFKTRRPVILNGINELADRPDLVDRMTTLFLPTISEASRRPEEVVMRAFERDRPKILGALLTAVSAAIRTRNLTKLDRLPRMADLALWVTAAESALGWKPGRYADALMRNRAASNDAVIESSIVGQALISLVERGPFSGTASELLKALEEFRPTPPPNEWPRNAKAMSEAVRRVAPNLRATGVDVTLPTRKQGRRKRAEYRLERVGQERSAPAAPAAIPEGADHADHADCLPPTRSESDVMQPCRQCGRSKRWRLLGDTGLLTCYFCHPPVDGVDVEWMPEGDPRGGEA